MTGDSSGNIRDGKRQGGLLGKKRTEFLKATQKGGWKTLEDLVADLDRARYWEDRPGPAEKRARVRRTIATLVFREPAPSGPAEDDPQVRRHVFASVIKATATGELARFYKQVFNPAPGELGDVLDAEETRRAYRTRRAALVEALADPAEEAAPLLLDELSEATLQRAWPGTGPGERRRIAAAAGIQHRRSEEALREISERCYAEGLDVEELLDGYLRATGAPRS